MPLSPGLLTLLGALLTLAVGVYAALLLRLAAAARQSRRRTAPPLGDADLPHVAVLVAARNEEHHLPRCLEALLAQDYPADRLHLYVADDHSTDRTAEVVREAQRRLAAHRPFVTVSTWDDERAAPPAGLSSQVSGDGLPGPSPTLHLVAVPPPEGHLVGKANALEAAIAASDADLLLITDADCAPPPGWARAMAAHLAAEGTGLVCGQTLVDAGLVGRDRDGRGRPLDLLQRLDWSFLVVAAAAFVEARRPITAMGNNMGVRRQAYEAVGGYRALPFSVTEDYTLFRAVQTETPFSVHFPLDPGLLNRTAPLGSLPAIFRQRRRWARGGLNATAFVYAVYAATYAAHIAPVLAFLLSPLFGLGLFAAKAGADAALCRAGLPAGQRPPAGRFALGFALFEAYFYTYLFLVPALLALRPRIRWKGRKL